jgi:hypothetical protein
MGKQLVLPKVLERQKILLKRDLFEAKSKLQARGLDFSQALPGQSIK